MTKKLKLSDIQESLNAEETIIEMVELMCLQSISPDAAECWDKVKAELYRNRSSLKEVKETN